MKKKELFTIMSKELGRKATYSDISSVVNILIDEAQEEILRKKKINILNFGKIELNIYPAKMVKNVRTGEMTQARSSKRIKLALSPNLIEYLKNIGET